MADNVAIATIIHSLDTDETHTLCGMFIDADAEAVPTEAPVTCLGCDWLE